MIYTKLTIKAMQIAYEAHRDQIDKSGVPYIFHPIHLAEQCNDEYPCVCALLHDVVEDCSKDGYTFSYLEENGIPKEAIDALELLTHNKDVAYMDYVKKLSENPIARQVKILDLKHNLDENRLMEIIDAKVKEKLLKKREIYKEALKFLEAI